MSISVDFYYTGDNEHVMDKSLTVVASAVSCDFKRPVQKDAPVLFVSGDVTGANYAYIADFGRYYWVYPETGLNATTTCRLESDPLMSFKSGILASPAVIARNPWHFDMYLPDPKLPVEARAAISTLKFPETAKFDGSHNSYILITLGSG